MDCKRVTKNIRTALKNYIQEHGLKSLVIGVSGGADSAACCALARPVCGELNIPLIGRSISIESNKVEEIRRAQLVGKSFCHDFIEVDYTALYKCMCDFFEISEGSLDKIARGNIKARIRMQYLYSIAGKRKGMVLSPENLTENLIGFFTLCGDVGDFTPIHQLWKTEVYRLMDYLMDNEPDFDSRKGLCDCKCAVPTDGLGISDSDLDQIGAKNYNEVDRILKTWLTKDSDDFYWDDSLFYEERILNYDDFVVYRETLKDHPVVQRHERTHFKRKWPINLERGKIFK